MAITARMEQLEALLADDPGDAFLRYGLAMEHFSLGDDAAGVLVLEKLIATAEPPYIPAYLMAGQALIRSGRDPEAATMLKAGIEAATKAGNTHALGEMQGFLATVE